MVFCLSPGVANAVPLHSTSAQVAYMNIFRCFKHAISLGIGKYNKMHKYHSCKIHRMLQKVNFDTKNYFLFWETKSLFASTGNNFRLWGTFKKILVLRGVEQILT